MNNLPLPTPDFASNSLQQPPNDIQQAPSGQINVSAVAPQQSNQPQQPNQPQQSNRLRRKVIRKKAKASFQDRNSLPLAIPDNLMSSASESKVHKLKVHELSDYSHYIPALPVENNFGTRLASA